MLNGAEGPVEAGLPSVAKPPVAKAAASEAKLPVGQKAVAAEVQKGGDANAEQAKAVVELASDLEKELKLTPEDRADVVGTVKAADENGRPVEALRAIAVDGDLGQCLALSGQADIDRATNAPIDGEVALTDEQRKNLMAVGCDKKIGDLQLRLANNKNKDEIRALRKQIFELQEKKALTGITENIFDGLAMLCGKGGSKETREFIADDIENGRPIVAIAAVLDSAVTDISFREDLLSNFRKVGMPEDLIDQLGVSLDHQAKRKQTEKKIKTVGNVLFGFSFMGLLMAYLSSKERQEGMG